MGFVALWFEIKGSIGQDFFADRPQKDNAHQENQETEDRRDENKTGKSKSKGKGKGKEPKKEQISNQPFSFVLGRFSAASTYKKALHDLGQAVNYANEACRRQHRQFCFSISMSGLLVRFIRWDRAGAIVSEAFDIHANPGLLYDFLWCFAKLSDADRGYDLTVEPASANEEDIFKEAIKSHLHTQVHVNDDEELEKLLDEHFQSGAVTSIHLPLPPAPHADATKGSRLLVSRPISIPQSVAGRSTRTFWALDLSSGRVILLKDTWRYDVYTYSDATSTVLQREGDVLDGLNRRKVEHIPQVVYHGDVPEVREVYDKSGELAIAYYGVQTTVTQDYVNASWLWQDHRRIVVNKRTHYRMTLNIAGYTLLRLRGTSELLHAAYDAFQASKQASDKADRVHRDITPGNIILFNESTEVLPGIPRKGFLVDWDLSMDKSQSSLRQQHEVSATWQFLANEICESSRNMLFPLNFKNNMRRREALIPLLTKVHKIEHDMESILYVVLYCAVLWTRHETPGSALLSLLQQMFDAYNLVDTLPTGGGGKLEDKQKRTYSRELLWCCGEMSEWLEVVMDYHGPLAGLTPPKRFNRWTPTDLDTFWAEFLNRNKSRLPQDDRINIMALHKSALLNQTPYNAFPRPNQGTKASPPREHKRRAVEAAGLDPKRARRSYDLEGNTTGNESVVGSDGTGRDFPPETAFVSDAPSPGDYADANWPDGIPSSHLTKPSPAPETVQTESWVESPEHGNPPEDNSTGRRLVTI